MSRLKSPDQERDAWIYMDPHRSSGSSPLNWLLCCHLALLNLLAFGWIKNIHSLVSQQGSRYIWTLLLCRVSDSPASLLRERWICYLVCSNPVTHRGKILINCKVGQAWVLGGLPQSNHTAGFSLCSFIRIFIT